MLSCGEPSGDLYAGALTRELRRLDPAVTVSGLGGPQFAAAGGALIADYRGLAVTGLTEAIGKLPQSFATLRRLVAFARATRPDALVVIDFPDFNFRLARRIARLGIPVIYYISPADLGVAAGPDQDHPRDCEPACWSSFRSKRSIYRDAGVPVSFVGHPLIDLAGHRRPGGVSPPAAAWSRRRRRSPSCRAAGRTRCTGSCPTCSPPPTAFAAADARRRSSSSPARPACPRRCSTSWATGAAVVVEGETDAVLSSADVALTASGTATVQCALHDTPMVIVYRVSPLTYLLGRRLLTVDTFGMVNLIAGEKIVPELIQDAFTPDAVAREAISMLTDRARHARIRKRLALVRERLGGPGASRRAAEAILGVVRASRERL